MLDFLSKNHRAIVIETQRGNFEQHFSAFLIVKPGRLDLY
jgi:hypothetical protein